jgi:hypothetical protein
MHLRLPPYLGGGSWLDTSKVPAAFSPEDHGFLGWTFDPMFAQSSTVGTAGTLYINKVKLPGPAQITNLHLFVGTAGATLTASQCYALLYSPAGVLLGQTAAQNTAWTTTGLKTMALTASARVQNNFCYVGFYSNGTTQPAFLRGAAVNTAASNMNLATPSMRFASVNTGLTTTIPNPFQTTQTATINAYWAAVSGTEL